MVGISGSGAPRARTWARAVLTPVVIGEGRAVAPGEAVGVGRGFDGCGDVVLSDLYVGQDVARVGVQGAGYGPTSAAPQGIELPRE